MSNYEEQRKVLSSQCQDDAETFYYEEAQLKMRHGKDLSEDNEQALQAHVAAFKQRLEIF